jgi:hypothetical protein
MGGVQNIRREHAQRFPDASLFEAGKYVQMRTISCSQCGKQDTIRDSTHNGLPADTVANKFRQRGWRIGSRASNDACSACANAKAQKANSQVQMGETLMVMPKPQLVADPPRQPTIVDRRRIMNALDVGYDAEAGRYHGEARDASIAEELDLPRAWVTELRSTLYGESERNEADAAREALAKARDSEIDRLQGELNAAMELLARIDGELRQLKQKAAA